MHNSTVYPQNNATVYPVGQANNPTIVQQHPNTTYTPSKRCIQLSVFLSVVALLIVCAIAIPLALSKKCDKETSKITMETTTMEAKITKPSMATTQESGTTGNGTIGTRITTSKRQETGTTGNNTIGTRTTTSKSQETMASEVSSDYGTQPMDSIPTNMMNTDVPNTNIPNTDAPNTDAMEETTMTSSIDLKSMTTTPPKQPSSTNTPPKQSSSSTTTPPKQSSSTTPLPLNVLIRKNDTIIGLQNTVAGGNSGSNYSPPRAYEGPKSAIDGDLNTKYYNIKPKSTTGETGGIGTGFIVIPSISRSTVARALRFAVAKDMPGRDPITVTLEGSQATGGTALNPGSSWTLIYNGSSGIDAGKAPIRSAYVMQQYFNNEQRFASYRLLITSKRDPTSDGVQYAEAEILGTWN